MSSAQQPDLIKSEREQVLEEALRLTSADRNAIYGDPTINLSAQARFINLMMQAAIENTKREFSEAELQALTMLCCKLARICCGAKHRDNYVDLSAYAAIAWECCQRLGG
jgi:Domain of unknown function (DUF6378)